MKVRMRQYSGPLTVLAMGTLGFSLFCIVSAVALAGADQAHPVAIAPKNIVDSAFSNLNTMAALTVDVISQYVFTPTATLTPSLRPAVSNSSTSTLTAVPTRTRIPPTKTRGSGLPPVATLTPTRVSPTPTQIPSKTPVPPTYTNTPLPTNTLVPSDTPIPPDTSTPELPTATEPPTQPPVDTATSVPIVNPTATSQSAIPAP